jgi:Homeodomain-like domain
MRNVRSSISEEAMTLQERLQRAHDRRKNPRLPMLSLLASRHARSHRDVARLLAIPRHTISYWLARYEAGGLDALLARYAPAGKPPSLPPDALAAMEQALRPPAGFPISEARRQWAQRICQLKVHDHTL